MPRFLPGMCFSPIPDTGASHLDWTRTYRSQLLVNQTVCGWLITSSRCRGKKMKRQVSVIVKQLDCHVRLSVPRHAAKLLQLCLTLCDPIDGSPPGSPVPRILQARTLEWVAISFSNAWKWKWSRSVLSDSSRPHRLQPTRLLHPWDFPGKSTGVGCHCLLQCPDISIFLTEWPWLVHFSGPYHPLV